MPRIRTIKPKFWDDTKLSKVSRDARLLYIGMWNFCDDLGVLIGEPVWIKSKIFPYDTLSQEQFNIFLNELVIEKFIISIKNRGDNYIYVPKFNRHQKINKPNTDDIYIDKEALISIIEQSRFNHVLIHDEEVIDTVSIKGGKDSKGEDSKGKESIPNSENTDSEKKEIGQADNSFDFKKLLNPPSFPTWRQDVKSFLSDEYFIQQQVKDKKIKYANVVCFMEKFVYDKNLEGDFKNVPALKKHFGYWYKKHIEHKNGNSNNGAMSSGFIEVPSDFDYDGENVVKW